MSDRPSDAFELDELRDEFDWMFEFNSRMAESIRKDPDVHNLAAHVSKLERENASLRELVRDLWLQLLNAYDRKEVDEFADRMRELGVEVDG